MPLILTVILLVISASAPTCKLKDKSLATVAVPGSILNVPSLPLVIVPVPPIEFASTRASSISSYASLILICPSPTTVALSAKISYSVPAILNFSPAVSVTVSVTTPASSGLVRAPLIPAS